VVQLELPMHIFKNSWYENSISVERGPLIYALKIGEEWKKVKNEKDPIEYGDSYYEVYPTTPWNYGLINVADDKMEKAFTIVKNSAVTNFPWNPDGAPIQLKTKAKQIPSWKLYNDMAGPIPYSITYQLTTLKESEEIILIPYGCTNLRIAEFPVLAK